MDESVYKLCKRGHVKSPDNVYADGSCRECRKEYDQRPERKTYYKNRDQRPEVKSRQKEYRQRPEVKLRESTSERHKKYRQRPENKERKAEYMKDYRKEQISNITDSYVANKLRIPIALATPELIAIKRNQLLFKRELKQLKQAIKGDQINGSN